MTTPKNRHVSEPALARKNMDMDVHKLAAARLFLGTNSDTETVDRALDEIVMHGEVMGALDRLAALGGVNDIYATPARKTHRARQS
jgi:hypothetical protein